jgi:hypothetical protein
LNAQRLEVRRRLLALLRPRQPAVRGRALAGVACRRRQKKYESPGSTPVAATGPHAAPAPRLRAIVVRQPRRRESGEVYSLGGPPGAGPAPVATVHRSVLVRAAVCHQVAQRATHRLNGRPPACSGGSRTLLAPPAGHAGESLTRRLTGCLGRRSARRRRWLPRIPNPGPRSLLLTSDTTLC